MIVKKIEPQGYCGGVVRALDIVNKALDDKSTKRPIYMLGHIIHNSHVISELEKKGCIILNDKNQTKEELLSQIEEGTVIFSAHGVSPSIYTQAQNKGLNIIDATCPNVLIVHNRMKKYLSEDYSCIYLGTHKHPECEGVLGISNKIHFVGSKDDVVNLNIQNDKIYVTNQTTLSKFDIEDIFNQIRRIYPHAIIDDKICNATTIRQQAMANQDKVDLCIVVGDKASSNTKKLAKVSKEIAGIETLLCEDLESLDKSRLNGVNTISISSGASTPSYIVDEIIEYLKNL